jgi:glycosyltransferase involved in cell wall biosynthesis
MKGKEPFSASMPPGDRQEPLVSIVTPVYNEAKYLAESIESVLSQTYDNWDYTIVDNCSTDATAEIARCYAAKEPRIRVIQNESFLPAISNHNRALECISPNSKYCKVVLGDDWLYPECLERMVDVAERYPSVGIVGAYGLEGTRVICTGLPYSTGPLSGREICRKHLLERLFVFGSATSVLYRSELVRQAMPLYNQANIHADTEACFKLLRTSHFGFIHQVLTYTRVRPHSLTAMSNELHTSFAGVLQLLVGHGPEYLSAAELQLALEKHVAGYYRFLGTSWLRRRRDAAFWEYHKRKFVEAGVGFSSWRLGLGVLKGIGKAALQPAQTVRKLLGRDLASSTEGSGTLLAAGIHVGETW